MVTKSHKLPVIRQCRLLEISRSSAYYRPGIVAALCKHFGGWPASSKHSFSLLDEIHIVASDKHPAMIDKIHLDKPFLGSRADGPVRHSRIAYTAILATERANTFIEPKNLPSNHTASPILGFFNAPFRMVTNVCSENPISNSLGFNSQVQH